MAKPKRQRFTLAIQDEFVMHMREGMRRGAAAELLGFTRMTIMDYIEEHPAFEKRVVDAEGEANEHVEEALYQAAVSGNVAAARAWMELRGGVRLGHQHLRPQRPSPELTEPPEPDEDELFPANVTRMDPRSRRQSS